MVERRSPKPHVGGSSPPWPAIFVMIKKAISFLEEVKLEFKKVVWAGKKEVVGATISVIVFTVIVAVILSVLDYFLSIGLQYLFR